MHRHAPEAEIRTLCAGPALADGTIMQDIQFINGVMERHNRILAREAKTAAAEAQPFKTALAAELPAPAIAMAEMTPEPAPSVAAVVPAAPQPITDKAPAKPVQAAAPQLSEAQMAMLMGSLGIQPEAAQNEAETPIPVTSTSVDAASKAAAQTMSPAQMSLLLSGFGTGDVPAAAKPEPETETLAEAQPQALEPPAERRFFPINGQNRGTAAATASDAYLTAMQAIEQKAGVLQAAP